eukprot:TRINITY_DN45285_c0_g1_i1.p2 TRINITY_DN45285_c0_g1~~TRINITY_DN45285_c0_g1_i1.p2  ORF type:complete len:180 (-),score=43.84 TRINITY_DN45285_c0_g1_i1:113-652(-)
MGRSRTPSRSRSRGGGGERAKIQALVDERQQCRRDRDFDRADKLREDLRDMGVNVDDSALTWRGPSGLDGQVNNGSFGGGGGGGGGGSMRRDGDWDCPSCGAMVFASKDRCFKCGQVKGSGRGGGGRDDRGRDRSRDRDRDRRSSRYDDDRDRRGGGGRRSSRYDDSDSEESSRPRRRR